VFKRILLIVLDSVGIGALPDAAEYGDHDVNTIGNIARSQGGLFLPTLGGLGLGSIAAIRGLLPEKPAGWFGKMAELSRGKDTTTGHWEIAGCPVFQPFPVYPDGFPPEITDKFVELTGRQILGNKTASGTEIIQELGEEHMATSCPIVYTSADSVLQIAAHEEVIPLPELYALCKLVREEICIGKHAVGRVIARPFIGQPGAFTRTANRHDYSLEPQNKTVLDLLIAAGVPVTGVGKISDIFAGRGITTSYPTKSNDDGMKTILRLTAAHKESGLLFANLVDFDSVYGHRNNIGGYASALERFDGQLELLLSVMNEDSLLIITADHGCDPTGPGTDHTREYVPLLVYCHGGSGGSLGVRKTFADIAATVADNFQLSNLPFGQSFLSDITR
jgi:phosphopentomutase